MILIQEVLIDEDIFNEEFLCNLNVCKGACCWEGDFGAPLEKHEIDELDTYHDIILSYLPKRSKIYLEKEEGYRYFKGMKDMGTALHSDGSCVYLTKGEGNISFCGIEQAWKDGKIPFRKPISCHLYPIRIEYDYQTQFEKMEYDRWDICQAACVKGKENQLPIYRFAKDAITRKYGEEFYDQLEQLGDHYRNNS